MTGQDDTPFLARWARRKQAARKGQPDRVAQADADAPPAPAVAVAGGDRRPTASIRHSADHPGGDQDEPPVDLAALPDIDDLTAHSDIAAFLRKGVPEELRRLALRRVWALDPQIRDFVEVAENQYDWNVPGGAPGYGDLLPGSDLSALLAQATGQVRDLTAGTAGGDIVTPEPVALSGGERAPDAPSAEAKPCPAAEPAEIRPVALDKIEAAKTRPDGPAACALDIPLRPDAASTSTPGEQAAFSTRPRQRRHGGALPVSAGPRQGDPT